MNMRQKTKKALATTSSSLMFFVMFFSVAVAAGGSFLDYVAQKESGGNQFATNANGTAVGSYQMTQGALEATGILKKTSPTTSNNYGNGAWDNVVWNDNPWGIKSKEDLLNNAAAQKALASQYESMTWGALQGNGVTGLVGSTSPGGVIMNEASLLECGYVLGASGCKQYLSTGELPAGAPDGYDDVIEARMAEASQYDASEITGQYTSVDNNGFTAAPGTGSACNEAVAAAQVALAKERVAQDVNAALDPITGFSNINGNSLISGHGLTSASTSSFGEMSCFDRIFSTGGVDLLFSLPSLDDIINQIMRAACGAATSEFRKVTAPLSQNFNDSVNLGGYFPGLNLGSMGGGVNANIRTGTGGINVRGSKGFYEGSRSVGVDRSRMSTQYDAMFN